MPYSPGYRLIPWTKPMGKVFVTLGKRIIKIRELKSVLLFCNYFLFKYKKYIAELKTPSDNLSLNTNKTLLGHCYAGCNVFL